MSLFTLENINKINIGDGSGTFVGVCGIAGGVSVEGILKVGGTGEYTGPLAIETESGGVLISTGSYDDAATSTTFNGGPVIDGGSVTAESIVALNIGTFGSTMTIGAGSITDSNGSISFSSNNLSTTGTIDFSGGVSLRGGVSINAFTFPSGLAPVAGQIFQTDVNGLISLTTNGGGGGGGGGGGTSINGLTDAFADSNNVILGNENASSLSGTGNTGIGVCVLYDLVSGSDNTAVGEKALEKVATGGFNVAVGKNSLRTITGSCNNVAIGHRTLHTYTGPDGYNTVIGTNSASGLTSSGVSGLTIIGASSGVGLTGASSNLTLIGYQVEPVIGDTSNTVYIGNGEVTKVYIQGSQFLTSDGRDKTDVEDSTYGLNIVDNLRPVEFTWDRRPILPGDTKNATNGQRSVGLIAQEVRDSLTEEENKILNLVNDSSEERFHMCYNNLIPVLVKAVKDLKAEVDTLKQRMDNCSC